MVNDEKWVERQLAKQLNINDLSGYSFRVIRKSLDARKKPIHFILRLEVIRGNFGADDLPSFKPVKLSHQGDVVIVGFGPAGMFAALELLANGIKPIVIERGKAVQERRRDLVDIYRKREVHPESNYCFGEGGAGTFSDGKLYTRSKKRGDIQQILRAFVEHGAPENILYDAHPHIGTNKLPAIVESIRAFVVANGGEVRFNTRLDHLIIENGQLKGVVTNNGRISTDHIILATGHSARDIFTMLERQQIKIEPKPFALGVRIEHPQDLIDKFQYKCEVRGPNLPPSAYSLVHQVNGRGVFSFCMCPGGIIAPAMTGPGEVVVNGWSPSKRNGKFANSGFVVQVLAEDWQKFNSRANLAAVAFQQEIESMAYAMGGSNLSAPAQRASDFVRNRISSSLPETSYIPGVSSVNLSELLPGFIAQRIREALVHFNKRMPGYAGNEAVLVGVESRTSSPVRIPRNELLQHPEIGGLYPCGEGAGYAGGIMSAALDGIACSRAIAQQMESVPHSR